MNVLYNLVKYRHWYQCSDMTVFSTAFKRWRGCDKVHLCPQNLPETVKKVALYFWHNLLIKGLALQLWFPFRLWGQTLGYVNMLRMNHVHTDPQVTSNSSCCSYFFLFVLDLRSHRVHRICTWKKYNNEILQHCRWHLPWSSKYYSVPKTVLA